MGVHTQYLMMRRSLLAGGLQDQLDDQRPADRMAYAKDRTDQVRDIAEQVSPENVSMPQDLLDWYHSRP